MAAFLAAAAAASVQPAGALAELGATPLALRLMAGQAAGGSAAARLAGARLLTAMLAVLPELVADALLSDNWADASGAGLAAACALAVSPVTTAAVAESAARAAARCAALRPAAGDYVATGHPRLAADAATAWYARQRDPDAADALELLLMACLASDAGAARLSDDIASEAHVAQLVTDMRKRRAMAAAAATGGASLLNPGAVGMATPYAMKVADEAESSPDELTRLLGGIDARALARYLLTILPPAAAVPPPPGAVAHARPAVVDASGGGAALGSRLAPRLPGCVVYSAERSEGAMLAAAAAARTLAAGVLVPLRGGDDGSLDALPVCASLSVLALVAARLDEAPLAVAWAAAKLAHQGYLVLVEEELEAMERAGAAAEAAGLAPVAAPVGALNAHFVRVYLAG